MDRIEVNVQTGERKVIQLTQAEVDELAASAAAEAANPARIKAAALDAAIAADTTMAALKNMTAQEFDDWWAVNVTNAAQAINVLKRIARLVIRRL